MSPLMSPRTTALVVEDDATCSDLLELVLLDIPNLDVHVVSTAAAARKALQSERSFALVITDVHLPGEDGLSLVEAMRTMPGRQGLPVVVLTSSRDEEIEDRASGMGVSAFFRKPYSPAVLRNAVNSILNGP
jgi:two-component system, chemotaxis family, chemotaxis protein CheY